MTVLLRRWLREVARDRFKTKGCLLAYPELFSEGIDVDTLSNDKESREFLLEHFSALLEEIFIFPKPFMTVLDGTARAPASSLGVFSKYGICTENTVFYGAEIGQRLIRGFWSNSPRAWTSSPRRSLLLSSSVSWFDWLLFCAWFSDLWETLLVDCVSFNLILILSVCLVLCSTSRLLIDLKISCSSFFKEPMILLVWMSF
jgi:hypothetical protein